MFQKIVLAATIALLSGSAFATDGQSYVGADFGQTKVKDYSGRESGNGVFVGFMMTPVLSLEAGFHRLAKLNVSSQGVNAKVTVDQLVLSVLASYPLGNNFSVFGRVGYNQIKVSATVARSSGSDSTNEAMFGVGAAYAFTPALSVRVEAQRPAEDTTSLRAGVVYKF